MGMNADFRPEARTRRLVVRPLDGETLVYDLDTNKAHCLNTLAGRLWKVSDGHTSVAAMQAVEGRSEDEIVHGLQRNTCGPAGPPGKCF